MPQIIIVSFCIASCDIENKKLRNASAVEKSVGAHGANMLALMYGATRVSHFQVMMYMTSVSHAHTWHPISIELGTERGSEKEQRNIQ